MAIREVADYILQGDASGLLTAVGSSSKAIRGLEDDAKRTDNVLGQSGRSMTDRLASAGSKMAGFGKAMTLGVTAPLTIGFGLMANAAAEDAEAQEILARNLEQTAGASDGAVESAEEYISSLSMMSGVTDDELRPALSKLASATGDTQKAQDLLAVALDTSVSKGKPLDAVAQALARAYMGNTGALGKMGIATKDAEGKALSFQQILTTLKGQTEGAAQAAGETGAGGMRRAKVAIEELKESIGEKLLPVLGKAADILNAALGWFNGLGSVGQNAALGIGAFAIALGPIATGVGTILKNAGAMRSWIAGLGAAGEGAAGGIGALWGKIGGLAGFLKGAGFAAVLAGAALTLNKILGAADNFRARWSDTIGKSHEGPTALNESLQKVKARFDEISNSSLASRGWQGVFGDTRGVTEEMKRMQDGLRISISVINEVSDRTGIASGELWKLADRMRIDLSDGSEAAKRALTDAATGATDAAGGFGEMGGAAGDAVDPVEELSQALKAVFDPVLDFDEAKQQFEEIAQRARDLAADDTKRGQDRRHAAQDIARDLVKNYEDEIAAAARNGASQQNLNEIQKRYQDELHRLAAKFPEVAGQASNYAAMLKSVPPTIDTTATAYLPQKAVDTYERALAGLERDRITNLKVKYADEEPFMARLLIARDLGLTGVQAVALAKAGKLARGGNAYVGDLNIVGEEGPELVQFTASARVIDHDTSRRVAAARPAAAAGGATVVNQVTIAPSGSVLAQDDLVRMVEDGLARAMRRQGSLAFLN